MQKRFFFILMLFLIVGLACGGGNTASEADEQSDSANSTPETEATSEPTEEPTSVPTDAPPPTATEAPTEEPTSPPTHTPETITMPTEAASIEPVPPFPTELDIAFNVMGAELYHQVVPQDWFQGGGYSQIKHEDGVWYSRAASTKELLTANNEIVSERNTPPEKRFVSPAQGDTEFIVKDGAFFYQAIIPANKLDIKDPTPATLLNQLVEDQADTFTLINGPTEMTIDDAPAAAVIRTGSSQDGSSIKLVTVVVATEVPFFEDTLITYMTGYMDVNVETEMMPILGWMINNFEIDETFIREATPTSEPSEVTPTPEPSVDTTTPADTSMGTLATTETNTFNIQHPDDWAYYNEPGTALHVIATSQELAENLMPIMDGEASSNGGAAVYVLAMHLSVFGMSANDSPADALEFIISNIPEDDSVKIVFQSKQDDLMINGYPAASVIIDTTLSDGTQAKGIMLVTIKGETMGYLTGMVFEPDIAALYPSIETIINSFEFNP